MSREKKKVRDDEEEENPFEEYDGDRRPVRRGAATRIKNYRDIVDPDLGSDEEWEDNVEKIRDKEEYDRDLEEEEEEEEEPKTKRPRKGAKSLSQYYKDDDFYPSDSNEDEEEEEEDDLDEDDSFTEHSEEANRWRNSRLFKINEDQKKWKYKPESATEKEKLFKYWVYFANFCSSEMNVAYPFDADEKCVTKFLQLLLDCRISQAREVKDLIVEKFLKELTNGSKIQKQIRMPQRPSKRKATLKYSITTGSSKLMPFIQYCCRNHKDYNPFGVSVNAILQYCFHCMIDYKSGLGGQHKEVKSFLEWLDKYHVNRPLFEKQSINDMLEALKLVDVGLNDAGNPKVDAIILRLTPSFKFWKYVRMYKMDEFWYEKEIEEVLNRIVSGDKNVDEEAAFFGVTPEMILANLSKFRRTEEIPPKKAYLSLYGKKSEEDFWSEDFVQKVIDKVRYQESSPDEGSYLLGVNEEEFMSVVGDLQEPRTKGTALKPSKSKKNEIERQATAIGDLSEYEQVRRKNIEDRLALFRSCGFDEFKNDTTAEKPKPKKSASEILPRRAKSARVQTLAHKKKAENVSNIKSVVTNRIPISVPPVNDLPLNNLITSNMDFVSSSRFLFRISDKFQRKVEERNIEFDTDKTPETRHVSCLTLGKLSCVQIYPESCLELVAGGDETGALGLWIGEPSRNCSFQLHSSEITSLSFNGGGRRKVVTSSLDGFIRVSDLIEQKVNIAYQWSCHGVPDKDIVCHVSEDEEVVLVARKDSSITRIDLRTGNFESDYLKLEEDIVGLSSIVENRIGVIGRSGVRIYDLRSAKKSFEMVKIASPKYAEFSPGRGELLLIQNESVNVVFDTKNLTKTYDIDSSVSRTNKNTTCVWHPTRNDFVYTIRPKNLDSHKNLKIGHSTFLGGISIDKSGEQSVKQIIDDIPEEFYGIQTCDKAPFLVTYNGHGSGMISVVDI